MSPDFQALRKRIHDRMVANGEARSARVLALYAAVVPTGDITLPYDEDREDLIRMASEQSLAHVVALRDLIDGGWWCRKDHYEFLSNYEDTVYEP